MCKCCFTTSSGMRQYTNEFEPVTPQPFDDMWERKLTSVQQVKGKLNCDWLNAFYNSVNIHVYFLSLFTEEMHKFIAEQLQTGRVPLCINPQSAAFKSFAR